MKPVSDGCLRVRRGPDSVERKSRMETETEALRQSSGSDVLDVAADKAQRYVREIVERRVGPCEAAVAERTELHEPFHTCSARPNDVITRTASSGHPAA